MNKLFKALLGIVFLSLLIACARLGQPPGGPKDEDAPKVVKSKPYNYSTNYKRNNVYIGFDEYVTLKNAYTEFTISPPLEKTPIPTTKGKGVVVELRAASLDSVTYTLDFGQSISDNNEGNPLPNFQFVISKQTYIDSFSISGKVLDAYSLKPNKDGLFVYMYKNLSDTIPYTTMPSYLGRTTPEGNFTINHIAPGTYAVFALQDANANKLFDMASEIIGFTDEPVYLYADSFPALPDTSLEKPLIEFGNKDSLLSDKKKFQENNKILPLEAVVFSTTEDSIIIENKKVLSETELSDTTQSDSIAFMVYGYKVNLYSFLEPEPINQYLSDYKRSQPEKLEIFFNSALESLPDIILLNPDTIGNWYILESNTTLDTLVYWLPDSNLISNDSIVLAIVHPESDTTHNLVTVTDTLLFRARVKDEKNDNKRKGGLKLPFGKSEEVVDTLPKKEPRMNFKHNINSKSHDLNLPIVLTYETPVFNYNPNLVELFRLEDSIEVPVKFTLDYDSLKMRKAIIKTEFESATSYVLKLYEGVFTDIFNRTIDSVAIRFQTQRDDYYGLINVDMKNISSSTILQLLDKDEKLVKQVILYSDKIVTFDFLNPAKYKLKVILDDNDNGKWDTGIYKLKLQPEWVDYFPTELDVRSNWSMDYEWEIKH